VENLNRIWQAVKNSGHVRNAENWYAATITAASIAIIVAEWYAVLA